MRPTSAAFPGVSTGGRGGIIFRELPAPDFALAPTLSSGQVFRWRPEGDGFRGWIGGAPVWAAQRGDQLAFSGAEAGAVARFFALDVDLRALAARIDVDPFIHGALERHWGLRMVRQEPWECLAAFILSAYNNTVRLTGMLDRLAVCFGEEAGKWRMPGELTVSEQRAGTVPKASAREDPSEPGAPGRASVSVSSGCATRPRRFPSAERLARVPEKALRACGLGYRAPYVKAAAAAVASGRLSLERAARLEDGALREALLTVPGVGEKVVECVMLFGYARDSAFPVDVWIQRIMRANYFRNRKVPDKKIRAFALRHFGPDCGWAQQYLFHAARTTSGRAPAGVFSSRRPSRPA